jgi:hypothetical protein
MSLPVYALYGISVEQHQMCNRAVNHGFNILRIGRCSDLLTRDCAPPLIIIIIFFGNDQVACSRGPTPKLSQS